MPMTSQGLNLPQRVRVRSIILPIMGSLSASKILAATTMAVIAPNCALVRSRVNRTKVMMQLVNRKYTMSRPTVPRGNMIRFLFLVLRSSI